MIKSPKVLAVIPARGGSKRLPRKNIALLNGQPMIAYTIKAAKEAKKITDFLVSTDDEEIKTISIKYGAPVPFIRPKSLATDTVRNIDVMFHAVEYMERLKGYRYDILVLLQPTSPFRSASHIDIAIDSITQSNLQSLASVKGPFQKRDPILKVVNSGGQLVDYSNNPKKRTKEFFIYNAALYVVKRRYFGKHKKIISPRQIPLIMDKYHSIDVDDISDFRTAEIYLQMREKGEI